MCTETFLRLPEEKRKRFLDAAWEEFVSVPKADASINQIVRRAGIPRGSFYQYFTDKEDLFHYLMETVIEHLISEYRKIMEQAGGNIFRTQEMCFDQIARLGSSADAVFAKSLKIAQLNPGLLPQAAMAEQLMGRICGAVQDVIDVSELRSREAAFVAHIFGLTLVSLAVAVVKCLKTPENTDVIRQGLLAQLDIIKHGSLAADAGRTEKEETI